MVPRVVAWYAHYSARAIVVQNIWSYIDRNRRSCRTLHVSKRVTRYDLPQPESFLGVRRELLCSLHKGAKLFVLDSQLLNDRVTQ
jgi:hypothetical protein